MPRQIPSQVRNKLEVRVRRIYGHVGDDALIEALDEIIDIATEYREQVDEERNLKE